MCSAVREENRQKEKLLHYLVSVNFYPFLKEVKLHFYNKNQSKFKTLMIHK